MVTFDGILYKATGGFVELDRAYEGFSAVTGAVLHEEHNKCPVLTLTLTSYADIEIDYRDSVQVGDRRYYALTHWSGYAARAAGRGEWEAKLYGAEQFMYKAVMYDTQEVEDTQEYTWQRQKNDIVQLGSLRTFGEWLCYNTNAVQGQRLFEYVHFTEAADEAEDFKVPAFNADNCLSCLYDVCELFGVDYEITEGVDAPFALRFVPARSVTLPGVYGTEVSDGVNELRSLSLRSADEEVYTQFEVTGGSDNLPLDYPHTELWLDENAYPLSSVYLPELYGRWGRSLKRINLPDVKPTFTGHVTAVDGTDRCRVQDIALAGKAQAWGLVGASLDVLTGGLMGYSFDIEHVDAAGWVTVREVSEAGTLTLPNGEHEAYQFKVGDTFTLTGLMLPDEYVTNAQARLLSEAQKQIEYYSAPRFECEITPSPGFVGVCGALMRIVHPPIGMDKEMVVRAIERDLRTGEVTRVTVGDFKTLTLGDSVVKRANRAKSEAVREAEAVTVASEAKQRAATASSVAQAREQMAAKLGFNSWQELADVAESAEGAPFNKIGDKWFLNADFVNALALVADEAFIENLVVKHLMSTPNNVTDGTGWRFRTVQDDWPSPEVVSAGSGTRQIAFEYVDSVVNGAEQINPHSKLKMGTITDDGFHNVGVVGGFRTFGNEPQHKFELTAFRGLKLAHVFHNGLEEEKTTSHLDARGLNLGSSFGRYNRSTSYYRGGISHKIDEAAEVRTVEFLPGEGIRTGHVIEDGVTSVTSLFDLPVNVKQIIATCASASQLYVPGIKSGQELYVTLKATASFVQPLPDTGEYRCIGANSLDMAAGDVAEISILCVSDTGVRYSIIAKKR